MVSRTVRRRFKKCVLWLEVMIILVLGAAVGVVAGAFYQISKVLPPESYLKSYRTPAGTTIFSSDGVLLARLADENREWVPLDRIPKVVQQAAIDIEDARFYRHSGLDFRGLTRAVWVNVRGGDLTGQGASTITQQLARNIYLTRTKTFSRKIKEALLAVQIERNWSKQQILEMYLNQVYFGSLAYGIQSASKTYFGKDVGKLTLAEAATLAGLPQRPSSLSPYVAMEETGSYNITISRRNQVLQRMADLGDITPDEATRAMREPMKLAHKKAPQLQGYYKANYFVDFVVRQLRETYGEDMVDKGGLKVITTLNYRMQLDAERAAREGIRRYGRSAHVSEAAIACVEPSTGYIKAMVGGIQEPWRKYQFNCAVQAKRSPGSAFKAFVYAAALERGWTPYKSVSAYVKPIFDGDKYWAPRNHGKMGGGRISLVSAFSQSVNTCAVNLGLQVGPGSVADMAHRLGIKSKLRPVPSLALGTSEVNPLEMAGAYAVFANGGNRAEVQSILKITNQEGTLIETNPPRITKEVIGENVVRGMEILTRSVVTSGTGRAAAVVPDSHGKTGTAEDHKDAWFVGFTPELSTAVWVGNRDSTPMRGLFGGTICAPIWASFMRSAVARVRKSPAKPGGSSSPKSDPDNEGTDKAPGRKSDDQDPQPVPVIIDGNSQNLLRVKICTDSQDLATRFCPSMESRDYLSGDQPSKRCELHSAPPDDGTASRLRGRDGSQTMGGPPAEAPRRRKRKKRPTPPPAPAQDPVAPDASGDGATEGTRRPATPPRKPAGPPTDPPTDDN